MAKRGHDIVVGKGMRDLVCGGRGNDALDGGPGRDRLYGERGRDFCSGERREPRFHVKCDAHRSALTPRKPPRPTFAQKHVLDMALSARGGLGVTGDEWFSCDDPQCPIGSVDYGNLHIVGDYMNPAPVLVESYRAYWNPADGELSWDSMFIDYGGWFVVRIQASTGPSTWAPGTCGATVCPGSSASTRTRSGGGTAT